MTKFTVFNERRNYTAIASNFTVARNKLKILEGNVEIAGTRAVDNANFIVPSPVDVKVGDIISFIADDVNTDDLIGAWNFYFNLKDESGYNLDGVDSTGNIVYARETQLSSRFLGHPYINFNNTSPSLQITPTALENNHTMINLDYDSNIVIWCRIPTLTSGETEIIFDRSTSNNGIQIGVKQSGSSQYVFLRLKGSSGSWSTTTLNANTLVTANSDVMISVERYSFGSTQYKLSLNGNSYGNYIQYSGTIEDSSPPPIKIGFTDVSTDRFEGRLYSMRMYARVLTSTEQEVLFKRRQPYATMKFAGKVTRVDKDNRSTKILAAGFSSELLLKTEFTKELVSNLSLDTTGTSGVTGVYESKLLEDIVGDIVTTINDNVLDVNDQKYEFKFDNLNDEDDDASASWKTTTDQFHMRNLRKLTLHGKFVSLVRILAILGGKEYDSSGNLIHNNGADSFFMLPRKVLIFESSNIYSHADYSLAKYNIEDGGTDSVSIYNDVTVFGKLNIKFKTVIFNSSNLNFEYDLRDSAFLGANRQIAYVAAVYKETNTVFQKNFREGVDYDLDNFKLKFKVSQGSNDIFSLSLAYVDLENHADAITSATVPTEDERSYYYQKQNNDSIKINGKKSKRVYFPILEDMTTTAAVCRRLLGANALQTRKVKVTVPSLTNSVHIGTKVKVTKDIINMYNEELIVRSIKYKFPAFKTIVTAGDYKYDFLDNMASLLDTVNESESERSGVT